MRPRWWPRKWMVSRSSTARLASGWTSRATAKRSMPKERGAAAGEARRGPRAASAKRADASLAAVPTIPSAPEAHPRDLAVLRALELEVGAPGEAEERRDHVRGEALDGRVE